MANIVNSDMMDMSPSKPDGCVGCPHCGSPVSVSDRTLGVICPKCNEFFKKEDAGEIEYENIASPAIHDTAVKKNHDWRRSLERQADDQRTGNLKHPSYYSYRRTYDPNHERG